MDNDDVAVKQLVNMMYNAFTGDIARVNFYGIAKEILEAIASGKLIVPPAHGKSLTPGEARKKKKQYLESACWIPKDVLDSFDEMIVQCMDSSGSSKVYQKELIAHVVKKGNVTENAIFAGKFLDVEDYYRKRGWLVEYDKPAYCESYPAYYIFKAKK